MDMVSRYDAAENTEPVDFITIDSMKIAELEPILNFLFIVHNDIEMDEMLHVLRPLDGYGKLLRYIDASGTKQHYFIGRFYKYVIVLIQTADMGYAEVNAAINALNRAISVIRPRFIVMPGIAAGIGKEVNIGDIVIADKIYGYESEKRKLNDVIGRYPAYTSPRLYNLFNGIPTLDFNRVLKNEAEKQAADSMIANTPKLIKGTMISGEKLLDDPALRLELKSKFREAAALDMEGLGVASASIFNQVYDWIVIKGISDLGDGNKDENKDNYQIAAMRNVIRVLKEVFDNDTAFSSSEMKVDYKEYRLKKALISGSQCADGENSEITGLFLKQLSLKLIENDIKVISGYGLGVGPIVMTGIYEALIDKNVPPEKYSAYFSIFPFPRMSTAGASEQYISEAKANEYKSINRKLLCGEANVFIFAFGQKLIDDKPVLADGMLKELDYAVKNRALILPIGATGGTARFIYDATVKDSDAVKKYYKDYFAKRQYEKGIVSDTERITKLYLERLSALNRNLTRDNIDALVEEIIETVNEFS